jgi:putative ABC transport system permease protein
MNELRQAVRSLVRARGFTASALVTLALALGAAAAMFGVLDAVILRPLPFRAPDQVVMLWMGAPDRIARPAFQTADDWRQNRSLSGIAVFDPVSATVEGSDGAQRLMSARVSPNFFSVVGLDPAVGRGFSAEDAEQRQPVALISHRLWRTRYGANPGIVGTSIVIDGRPSQVIGVVPQAFEAVAFDFDIWEPHTRFADWDERRAARGQGSWFVVGRLRPDVSVEQAQAEMTGLAIALDEPLPAPERSGGITLMPLGTYIVGPRPRLVLWMMSGAIVLVLLIAVANLVSLSLARGVQRAPEVAVRVSLGAAPARIARQLLTEGVVLGAVACPLGLLAGLWALRAIRVLAPDGVPRLQEAGFDLRLLAWCVLAALLTGLVVGVAPARRLLRPNLRTRAVTSGFRRVLVAGQFALAVVLVVAAGLLVRSWVALRSVDLGFEPAGVASINILTTGFTTSDAQRVSFYNEVLERVEALPGVESAAVIGDLFTSGGADVTVTAEGADGVYARRLPVRVDEASERVFATLRTPLIRGRLFAPTDGPDAPPVAIVTETMARGVWPGRDPVGMRFKFGPQDSENPWITVVGIVGDIRRHGVERDPEAGVFAPLAQRPSANETLLVRTSSANPASMLPAVRAAIHGVDRRAAVSLDTTLDQRLADDLAQRRLQTALLIGFSIVALVIAAVGIYGLFHHSVVQRTREIGVRMALGARAGDILRLVMQEGLRLSMVGLALGLAAALWAGRLGASLLFGVTATDPATLLAVSALLTVVAAAACYFPARRAAAVDPLIAIRYE